jgi:outer membrane protein TolC
MQTIKVKAFTFITLILIAAAWSVNAADSLDIYTCFKLAESMSPLKKQEALIRTSRELSLRNISVNNFPELTVSGKATYQSDVFTFPLSGPAFDIPEIPKDQYQLALNLKQIIFDAGVTANLKKAEDARSSVAETQLKSKMYNIKNIVSPLFFSALILQENIIILKNSREILENQQKIIESRVSNGVVMPSALLVLEKELLNLDQRIVQAEYDRKTALELLSLWTESGKGDDIKLVVPEFASWNNPENRRPELELFRSQQELLESSKTFSRSKQLPYLYAFAQGGYGSPNPFNFFETEFSTFYMIGLQLNWKPFNWGNSKREIQTFQAQQDQVSADKEDFERNISMSLLKDENESAKLTELILKDREIVALQRKIVDMSYSQLQNGVITSSEYLGEFNSLTNAEISMKIHHILYAQVGINTQIVSGNIE